MHLLPASGRWRWPAFPDRGVQHGCNSCSRQLQLKSATRCLASMMPMALLKPG